MLQTAQKSPEIEHLANDAECFVLVLVALGLIGRDGGGPRPRLPGVDSGPGEVGSEGVRGIPEPYNKIYVYSLTNVSCDDVDRALSSTLVSLRLH